MNKLLWLIAAIIIGLGAQKAVLAQGGPPAANVRVAKAVVRPLAPQTIVAGTVISRNDARLAAEVPGRLLEVAEVGTVVAVGEPVARIEDTSIRLRKNELEAEVERAEARLKFLENEEKRYERLAESNLAAATQLEETRSDRDVSRGDLRVAKSRLAQVEDQLSRTRIIAPFGGIVVERLMMPGERVENGRNIVRLVDQQHLEVIARAPLEYYPYVRSGQRLQVKTGPIITSGVVRTVVAVGSEKTHQFELRLDIEADRFPVGQTVRVSVPTAEERTALVVPRDALVLRPEGISIFVVGENNEARKVAVTTGIDAGEQIEVSGDLADGDIVIVRGNERLRPGQTVSIMQG